LAPPADTSDVGVLCDMASDCNRPDAGCRMPDAGCRMPDATKS
jgi:hypothetical protein